MAIVLNRLFQFNTPSNTETHASKNPTSLSSHCTKFEFENLFSNLSLTLFKTVADPPLRFGPGYANEWAVGPESQSTFHDARPPDEWPQGQSRAIFVESMRRRHARCEIVGAAVRQASGWASALRVRSPPPQESHSEGFCNCPAARHPLPAISETHGCHRKP